MNAARLVATKYSKYYFMQIKQQQLVISAYYI